MTKENTLPDRVSVEMKGEFVLVRRNVAVSARNLIRALASKYETVLDADPEGWKIPATANDLDTALSASPPDLSLVEERDALKALAKRLSNTLLKLRPLGGSELFMQACGDNFADPNTLSQMIADDRQSLHDARCKVARLTKERDNALSVLKVAGEALDALRFASELCVEGASFEVLDTPILDAFEALTEIRKITGEPS